MQVQMAKKHIKRQTDKWLITKSELRKSDDSRNNNNNSNMGYLTNKRDFHYNIFFQWESQFAFSVPAREMTASNREINSHSHKLYKFPCVVAIFII